MKKLGEGGMSYVYLAKEISSDQEVAIKVLSPKLASDKSSVERLRREAGLAMRLDHPNVCRILRLGESEDGLIYLVMPFLHGDLLSDREVKGGPMDLAVGLSILRQVCAGLHHAHELQIIHRDLKPENIMLVPNADGTDRAVVMDFGLAKERRADPSIAKLTATGIILGTPEFMSPEQIRGKALDARSDVYALGIVAFEMFTGQAPVPGTQRPGNDDRPAARQPDADAHGPARHARRAREGDRAGPRDEPREPVRDHAGVFRRADRGRCRGW